MGYIYIYDVGDRELFNWKEGIREWDGYTGYTISPSITISVGSSTSLTMTIEITTDDALTFENGDTKKEIPLEAFVGDKTFQFEWKVKLLDNSIIEGPPQKEQIEISLPGQDAKKYDVLEFRLTPRIGFKITGVDSDEDTEIKRFYLTKMLEVQK